MMGSKITNPKSKFTDFFLKNLPIKTINGILFRVLVVDQRRVVTSCQCFKDCNCKGKIDGLIVTYYRQVSFDETDKAFSTKIIVKEKSI